LHSPRKMEFRMKNGNRYRCSSGRIPPANSQMVPTNSSSGMMPPQSGLFSFVHKRCSAAISAKVMAAPVASSIMGVLLFLFVLINDELCGFKINPGIYSQPFDKGGKRFLLFLVGKLYFLDQFVQPQPNGWVGYFVQLGNFFERAGFQYKVF